MLHSQHYYNLLVAIIILTGIGLVSCYIVAVHVISCDLSRAMQYLWKTDGDLYTIPWILLWSFCALICLIAFSITYTTVLYMESSVVTDISATCWVAYLVCITHFTCQMRQRTKEIDQGFYQYSVVHPHSWAATSIWHICSELT